jgi:hypothetical protein
MKKLFYLLLALPLFLASCGDDDDYPTFQLDVAMSGQNVTSDDDGVISVTQGDTLAIDSITIVNASTKDIALGGASYYWDHAFIGTTIVVPFGCKIATDNIPVGTHLLQINMPVLAVGYSVMTATVAYKVEILAPTSDEGTGTTTPSTGTGNSSVVKTVTPTISK